jgi:hypothetical protein
MPRVRFTAQGLSPFAVLVLAVSLFAPSASAHGQPADAKRPMTFLDMQKMQHAFRRDGDAQGVREGVLAGEREVGRMDDGFGRLADHVACPRVGVSFNLSRQTRHA